MRTPSDSVGRSVAIGHEAGNARDARVVVVSAAIKDDNPEVREARRRLVPVVRRAEMLAELMRLKWSIAVGGTHGKTTVPSLVAAMLDTAGLDPTVINGGVINAYGTNARLGGSEWLVAEADESDGTFLKLLDHRRGDQYRPGTPGPLRDFDTLRKAFVTFIENIPFYGFAVLCIDHPEVPGDDTPRFGSEDRRLWP